MSRVRPPQEQSQPVESAADRFRAQVIAILERIEARQLREAERTDEFRKVYLNAKFPHGKPIDRWGRR
jgi:hypothetical protein